MKPLLSIIIPVINEAEQIAAKLKGLQALREKVEILIVDGGSIDNSPNIVKPFVDQVLHSPRGRAKQMNMGAAHAHADILLFLHADTHLPGNALMLILNAMTDGYHWGRFDVKFDDPNPLFSVIAFMMNLRSRLTCIATGDQSLFMMQKTFEAVGQFPDIALMEDIAISKNLNKIGKPCCLAAKVTTSARRWQKHGILKTILFMWWLRLLYFFGANPNRLAALYYKEH